jgi:hypothetical protein
MKRKAKKNQRQFRVGDQIDYNVAVVNGRWWWFEAPPGVDPVEAFRTQPLHGPFHSMDEADEDFRVTVVGPQWKMKVTEVTEVVAWDLKWDE